MPQEFDAHVTWLPVTSPPLLTIYASKHIPPGYHWHDRWNYYINTADYESLRTMTAEETIRAIERLQPISKFIPRPL